MIRRAANFAFKCHENQKRKYTGAPYIIHPARVATNVAKWGYDYVIAAAWLYVRFYIMVYRYILYSKPPINYLG